MYFPCVLISMPENDPKGIMADAQATLMKSISNSFGHSHQWAAEGHFVGLWQCSSCCPCTKKEIPVLLMRQAPSKALPSSRATAHLIKSVLLFFLSSLYIHINF